MSADDRVACAINALRDTVRVADVQIPRDADGRAPAWWLDLDMAIEDLCGEARDALHMKDEDIEGWRGVWVGAALSRLGVRLPDQPGRRAPRLLPGPPGRGTTVKKITKRAELVELARQLGVRPDWHEPDEQGLTAKVYGDSFDNAMPPAYWYGYVGEDGAPRAEMYVVLYQDDATRDDGRKPMAAINLATLLAWATGLDS